VFATDPDDRPNDAQVLYEHLMRLAAEAKDPRLPALIATLLEVNPNDAEMLEFELSRGARASEPAPLPFGATDRRHRHCRGW